MKQMNVIEKIELILGPKKADIKARLFVTREDGIMIYDSIKDRTSSSVSALVSGVWQASEALMGLAHPNRDVMEFRLGFDTSSQGVYLFPFSFSGSRYFLGAIYNECLNPGQLKRQVALIKEELDQLHLLTGPLQPRLLRNSTNNNREGFLFQEISDEEIDRLFSVGGF